MSRWQSVASRWDEDLEPSRRHGSLLMAAGRIGLGVAGVVLLTVLAFHVLGWVIGAVFFAVKVAVLAAVVAAIVMLVRRLR
ncbi:MAG TPA: hypothetical protein VE990_02870 [Acidimicrobiales bacterium]|nr:hypothetical protein [Acidimicrobiales bacterium]